MSQRSLLELNHDVLPGRTDAELLPVARALRSYILMGQPDDLPPGVTFRGRRHHGEPDWLPGDDQVIVPRAVLGAALQALKLDPTIDGAAKTFMAQSQAAELLQAVLHVSRPPTERST